MDGPTSLTAGRSLVYGRGAWPLSGGQLKLARDPADPLGLLRRVAPAAGLAPRPRLHTRHSAVMTFTSAPAAPLECMEPLPVVSTVYLSHRQRCPGAAACCCARGEDCSCPQACGAPCPVAAAPAPGWRYCGDSKARCPAH